jgi:DmsE family decaheme c-type cytochrome
MSAPRARPRSATGSTAVRRGRKPSSHGTFRAQVVAACLAASGTGAWLLAISAPLEAEEVTAGAAPSSEEDGAAPRYLGQAICRACHQVEAAHWGPTIHGRLFTGAPRTDLAAKGCEGCHGPGSRHVAAPSDPSRIIAFTRASGATVERMNSMCLQCHASGARIYWKGSVHERQQLACSDCHNPMTRQSAANLQERESVSRTCFSCHPQQRADFRKRSHMPLLEGKIACNDCHQPHGSPTDPLLRADSVNQLCYRCHADKRGPFLWEHAPVAENCLNCHRPHGSNHEALLVTIPPFLCQRCHAQTGGFGHPNDLLTSGNLAAAADPDERILNGGCVNCHVQIHGSNHPSGARFHR